MSDWKPANYPSVSPYLISGNPVGLIEFLVHVFNGAVARRVDRSDGSLMHAEVRLDDSIVMIGGASAEHRPSGMHIHVYVPDACAVYERAIRHGARSVQPPARKHEHDDYRAGFSDTDGNTWWVANQ